MRDVRMVSELLLSSSDWSEAHFRPYIDEHRERLRRLRIVAKAVVSFRMHFGEAGQERRRRIARLAQRDPKVAELLSVQLLGPARVSVEAFDQATLDQIYMAT